MNHWRKKMATKLAGIDLKDFLKSEIKYLAYDAFGSALYAVGIHVFASSANFATGGVTGVSLILHHLFGLPIGTLNLFINLPLILLSLRFLGKKYLVRTIQTLFVNAFFLDVLAPLLPRYTGDGLLAAVFAGGFSGLGLAVIYMAGSCTGGSDLVIMSLRKIKPHLSIGQISLVIDSAIIGVGALIFKNIDAVLYGIIYTLLLSAVVDKLMYGFISGKMTLIFSEKSQAISEAISEETQRGSTYLKGEGSYSRRPQDVLLCACSKRQLPDIRRIVHRLDPDALMIVLESNEVRGEGFLPHDN